MSAIRRNPTHKLKARLIQETGGSCAFCEFNDAGHLEFHHIDSDRSNTVIENLIAVCPTCHAKITASEIPLSAVKMRKDNFLKKSDEVKSGTEPSNIKVTDSFIENTVIGNNNSVSFSVKKQVIKKNTYTGNDIGADTLRANYISYLITRYHEFKEREVGKENMKYGLFQASLKKEFKIGTTRTLYHLPVQKFEDLVKLIQKRIDSTMFAKKLGKLHKNYSSFEEYVAFYQN